MFVIQTLEQVPPRFLLFQAQRTSLFRHWAKRSASSLTPLLSYPSAYAEEITAHTPTGSECTVLHLGHPNGRPAAPLLSSCLTANCSQHRSQRDLLSPLTDRITALLKTGFCLSAEAEPLSVGQAAPCHLTSHSAGGEWENGVTPPIPSPNPRTWASWVLSEHARHTSTFVLCSPGLGCSSPLASAWLAGFLRVSAQVALGWFLWCWGSNSQSVAHAS